MRTLHAQAITADDFAAYGWLACADGRSGRPINEGSSLRVDDVGSLDLTAAGGAPCLAVFQARARDPSGPWQVLERHRLGTQTFVPLGGVAFVMLVATGDDQPDVSTLAAFVVTGDHAVTLRTGTWHHGLIALQDGDFIVIERQATEPDCDLSTLPEAVTLTLPPQRVQAASPAVDHTATQRSR